jgi:hypothetical protein
MFGSRAPGGAATRRKPKYCGNGGTIDTPVPPRYQARNNKKYSFA